MPRLSDEVEVAIVPARATPVREFKIEPRPRPYEVPPDVEFNGDLLRQVRMARGLSLAQLADRTRIGAKHLENVENDRYDALPATVYLRGILMNLARELGLDGLRVSKSYLAFVDAHRSKG
ncbi:MAG: helix-turn-helix domain-containing protein [Myxococcota bacterium]